MTNHLECNFQGRAVRAGMILAIFLSLSAIRAETIIFHLRNGDRIAGTIVSEDTNQVIISTVWTKSLAIPLSAIQQRERVRAEFGTNQPPAATAQAQPAAAAALASQPAPTNIVAAPKPAPPAEKPAPVATNTQPAAIQSAPVVAKSAGPTKPKPPKRWKADVRIGLDVVEGAKDRQLYFGRAKLTYEKPYANNPRKFFRNIFDYTAEYGTTDGNLSANRMSGSSKTDFDFARHCFVYNLGGAGYDEIRKIDLQYEIGPGFGYHLFTRTNFVLDTEIGMNYQVQERADNTETRNFYLRAAENFTWRLGKKLTMTEKFEFFPNAEDFSQYRARFECTLSYWLLQYLSFNLTALDLYDTQPAQNVSRNEFQFRSSVGLVF